MLPCLVLTAGIGTRLDPLTRLVAKPAVPLGTRTLIEHVLAWLHREQIRDVVLNLHHLPSTLTAIVGDGAHLGLSVKYSWEDRLLGSAGGPRHALPLFDADPLLVVNGDVLCDFSLASMLEAHLDRDAHVTMAVVPNPAPNHYNGILLDEADAVVGFVPKGCADGSWHFIGPQIVGRSVFADLPDGVPAETVAGLYRDIVRESPGRIRGWRAPARFLDVGTPADYLNAALSMSGPLLPPGVTRSAVWPGAVVAPSATLHRCIVAGDAIVPPGFTADHAIIVPERIVRAGDAARTAHGLGIFEL